MFSRFFQRIWPGRKNYNQTINTALQLVQEYRGIHTFSKSGHEKITRILPELHEIYTMLSNEGASERFFAVVFLYSSLLRKTGSFDEAARIARLLPASLYEGRVVLAMAEHALGNLEASARAYQQALDVQPDSVPVLNDYGNMLLVQGRLDEALALYEKSLQIDPSDPCEDAEAYITYLRSLQASSYETGIEKLGNLAKKQKAAEQLFYYLQFPYIGILPEQGEALINILRQFKEGSATGNVDLRSVPKIEIASSMLEAPSASLAAELMLEEYGGVSLSAAKVLSPDPREPLRPVEYQIWRYEGMKPVPAMPRPEPAIAANIAALALRPYALDRWHEPARELGQRLGSGALPSLLGVMVHPPRMPAEWAEWDWITAVQIASALTISYIDEGWEGSRRKAALTSLIYGPLDWSGAAALIALAVLARQDMRLNIELDRICCDLWQLGRGSGEWPLEHAMVFGLIYVNHYSEEAQKHLDAYFQQIAQEQKQAK